MSNEQSNKQSNKVFTKNFTRMFFANAIMCTGFYMLMPLLPVFAVKNLGIGTGSVGLILGVFAISAVVARVTSGALLDRYGRMIIFLPAVVIFGICFGIYIAATTFAALLTMRILHGLSWGTVSTSAGTIISDIVPQNLRGMGIGYFGLSMNLAMALGPAIAVLLMDYVHVNVIFGICTALVFIAFIISVGVKPPVVPKLVKPLSFSDFFEISVLPMAVLQFFYGFVYAGIMSYAILHGMERGIQWLGSFFLLFAVFISILRPYAGRMMDKQGPTKMLIAGYILLIIGYIMLGSASSTLVFLAASIPLGLGAGFIMPLILTMIINIVTPQRRGAANATFFSAFDVGMGIGAVALGMLAQHVGYANMYYSSAVFTAVPLLLYLLYTKKYYEVMFKKMNG